MGQGGRVSEMCLPANLPIFIFALVFYFHSIYSKPSPSPTNNYLKQISKQLKKIKMALFLCLLFLLFSSASAACNQCVLAKAAFFASDKALIGNLLLLVTQLIHFYVLCLDELINIKYPDDNLSKYEVGNF